ncbi:MOSC domain-containing protein [Sediminicoccus rosea]|jgi:MOSC domain-containing protein YiiM|uniref:MOSC domain-containing protein n=1 Tax=Sediminicoccus rosea TaxID=1225128 RepID=A0ABZ0PLP5_9PROT|nr:MOSC domain-containing protein [Sediminicoccus rosea]WPB86567.1 MOSC domain-containing protein [Sediminicoccus rosea]
MRPPPESLMARLLDAPMAPGRLAWIGLRPARRAAMRAVDQAMLAPGQGLEGDRWKGAVTGGRQVTLIAAGHLAAIGGFLGRAAVPPEALRRNLVIEGVNLLALKGRRFRIGAALLEFSGECHPCSRMEEVLGPGGYNAVRGHGGITARVTEGGAIRLGDPLTRVD